MILVTGGTGFIGQALIRHLVEDGKQVRTLIRPSAHTPELPLGVPVAASISSISDERSLRAAMVGIDTVFHLVGGEWYGASGDLHEIEIVGTQTLVKVAQDAGVKRLFYLSHLGADRASAYAMLKAKGIAEEHIRRSGIDYTIIRSALVFGPDDNFTTVLARLFHFFPFLFPTPGEGDSLLQPIRVEDLVTCLAWSLENDKTIGQTYQVGGPEYLSIDDVVVEVMHALGLNRTLLSMRPAYMRIGGIILEYLFPRLPISVHWLDYLAAHRTCAIDSLPRDFGVMPALFSHNLDYLKETNWRRALLRDLFIRPRPGPGVPRK